MALLACFLVSWAVRAEEVVQTPSLEQARMAFLEGMELVKGKQWEAATSKFLYAAQARRTPGLVYYAAYCLEQLGRFAEALVLYQEAGTSLSFSDGGWENDAPRRSFASRSWSTPARRASSRV
jgi:hypothetical protein